MRRSTFSIAFAATVLVGFQSSGDSALRAQDLTDSLATENGDVNGDGRRDIADAIYMLNWIFSTGPAPRSILCETPVSESPLFDGVTGEEVDGGATLVRTPEGLSMKLRSAAFPSTFLISRATSPNRAGLAGSPSSPPAATLSRNISPSSPTVRVPELIPGEAGPVRHGFGPGDVIVAASLALLLATRELPDTVSAFSVRSR